MLTKEQADLLSRMREDAERAGDPFRAGPHWQYVGRLFEQWFEEYGLGIVEELPYNDHFASYAPTHYLYYHYACYSLYRYLQTRDRWGVLPKLRSALVANSPRASAIEGRYLSWDMLISADTLLSIAEICPAALGAGFLLGDLGAGWGRVGMVFKQANPDGTYVVFDLPETLLISSLYLPRAMPEERFHFYDEISGGSFDRHRLCDGSVWLAGAHLLSRLDGRPLDCIVNIASLAEMPYEQQQAYWDLFARTVRPGGLVYNLQHDSGGQIHRADWRQLYHRHVAWSGAYFEEAFEIP